MFLFNLLKNKNEEKMPKDYLGYLLHPDRKMGCLFAIVYLSKKNKRIYRVMELKCDEQISREDLNGLIRCFEANNFVIAKFESCDTSLIDNKWVNSLNKGIIIENKFVKQGKQVFDKSRSVSLKEFLSLIPNENLQNIHEISERTNFKKLFSSQKVNDK